MEQAVIGAGCTVAARAGGRGRLELLKPSPRLISRVTQDRLCRLVAAAAALAAHAQPQDSEGGRVDSESLVSQQQQQQEQRRQRLRMLRTDSSPHPRVRPLTSVTAANALLLQQPPGEPCGAGAPSSGSLCLSRPLPCLPPPQARLFPFQSQPAGSTSGGARLSAAAVAAAAAAGLRAWLGLSEPAPPPRPSL